MAVAFAAPFASAKEVENIYRLGFSAGWMNYVEPNLISIYGLMFGVDGLAQLPLAPDFDLRIEGDAYYGNIQYDGSIKDNVTQTITPLKAGTYDYMVIARVKPEFRWISTGTDDSFINAGLGIRYLNDRVNSSSGYDREIAYLFLPVGIRLEDRSLPNTILGFDLEYDVFIEGKVKSHLSDTGSAYPDVTNTEYSGMGFRAQLEYRFLLGGRSIGFKPYFQYWSIDVSDTQPYITGQVLKEPANSNSQVGAIVDYQF